MKRGPGIARAVVALLLALTGCKAPVPDSGLRLIYEPAPGAKVTPDTQLLRVVEDRQTDFLAQHAQALPAGVILERELAIVVDGRVSSAPVVQERIPGGRLQITLGGMGSLAELEREAEDLSMALWSGALPCPVVLAEETTDGPSSR